MNEPKSRMLEEHGDRTDDYHLELFEMYDPAPEHPFEFRARVDSNPGRPGWGFCTSFRTREAALACYGATLSRIMQP